ncbi:MAG: hypothetical protein OEU49_01045, partial [Chromatiales bacterium]|nr:hypothetical protein [Chromatiales bacterium]
WFGQRTREEDYRSLEAGARRMALILGQSVGLALLSDHAQWALTSQGDERSALAAARLAAEGCGRLIDPPADATMSLALDG